MEWNSSMNDYRVARWYLWTVLCLAVFVLCPDTGSACLQEAVPESSQTSSPQESTAKDKPQEGESAENSGKRRRRDLDNWERDFNRVLRLHDPSTIVKDGETFWIVHTGQNIGSIYSTDLKNWKRGPNLLKEMPDWVHEVVPNHRGYYWAPDIIKVDDRYLVYYSVSSFGKNESAIGLISSPTLDPDSEDYKWTDHGIVVRTTNQSDHNAIDPAMCLTDDGQLWMSYGSFWSGLKMVQLDPKTGKLLDPDREPIPVAFQEQIEAPGIYFKDGYYYLFINWGWCCRGLESTYNIRVGRSKKIEGPYFDRDGVDLRLRGGTLVLESEGDQIGPGHASVFKSEAGYLLSYHYYDKQNRGRSRLGLRRLTWDAEGWPQIDRSESE